VAPRCPSEANAAHLTYLDGVRAIAATFVVLHHFYLVAYPGYPRNGGPVLLAWLLYGHLAVALFIIVSGISLALAPARNGLRLTSKAQYIQRRAWRIIPAYWAAIALSVGATAAVGGGVSAKSVLVHTLLVQNVVENRPMNGAFWSIAVEWQIYFFFPLVLFALRRTSVAVVVFAAIVASVACHMLGVTVPIMAPLDHVSPAFFALFVMGVACAALARPGLSEDSWPRSLVRFALPGSTVAVLLTLSLLGTVRYGANLFWVDLVVGPAFALALGAMLGGGLPRLRRVLSQRLFALPGSFSYSIYLVHAPILALLVHFLARPAGWRGGVLLVFLLLAGLPIILAGSYAFHLAAERPFLAVRSLADFRMAVRRTALPAQRPISLPRAAGAESEDVPA